MVYNVVLVSAVKQNVSAVYIYPLKIMVSSPSISWKIDGEKRKQRQNLFSWAPKSLGTVTAAMK